MNILLSIVFLILILMLRSRIKETPASAFLFFPSLPDFNYLGRILIMTGDQSSAGLLNIAVIVFN